MLLKTSKEWLDEANEKGLMLVIIDPDGWDRKNFNYSFNEEKIDIYEFDKRICQSTIKYNNK